MNYSDALDIAEELVEQMRPHCHRIEIAGSIRRQKEEVKDIEIVAIPRGERRSRVVDLFGQEKSIRFNLLHEWAIRAQEEERLIWIKTNSPDLEPVKPDPNGRQWKARLPKEINLDLFLCTPKNWGAIFLIRTGSAEFSKAIATRAKAINRPLRDGYFHWGESKLDTREEADVFKLLRIQPIKPEMRRDARDMIVVPERGL